MTVFMRDFLEMSFLQNAFFAGILVSISCGIMGSYIIVKRISYIAAGIAHCVLGGMGAAKYLNVVYGWKSLQPIHGAFVSAVISALVIGLISRRSREREDTAIGAIWSVGMALGLLFISQTPGYSEDLMSYLFGNILMITSNDLCLIAFLDIAVMGLCFAFYKQFLAICFDEEFARTRGVNVELYYLLLLVMTALTVVLLISAVGIILVIALLTIPVAIAGKFTNTLKSLMILSSLITAGLITSGIILSYSPDLPVGALTVTLAGIAYLLTVIPVSLLRKNKRI